MGCGGGGTRRVAASNLLLSFSLLDLYCEVHEEDDSEGCGGEEGERVDAREEEGRQGWDHVAHGVGQVRSVLLFNTRGCAVSKQKQKLEHFPANLHIQCTRVTFSNRQENGGCMKIFQTKCSETKKSARN